MLTTVRSLVAVEVADVVDFGFVDVGAVDLSVPDEQAAITIATTATTTRTARTGRER
jgi:hypothetical protein